MSLESGAGITGRKFSYWVDRDDDLEAAADEILHADGQREVCRICGGHATAIAVVDVPTDFISERGRLVLEWPELQCATGHRWFAGEGRARGVTTGANPVLLEEHLRDRRSREVYATDGVVDPSIERGLFWRAHPQGRRLATDDQRKGPSRAGFYA